MDYRTTYSEVLKSYPEIIKKLGKDLKSSKSKNKNISLSKFSFKYSVVERIEGLSFDQMVVEVTSPKVKPEMTIEEKVKDRVKRSSVAVECFYKGTRLHHLLKDVPEFIAQKYLTIEQEEAADRAKFEALPPEVRNKQLNDSLKELRKYPGFMEFRIG